MKKRARRTNPASERPVASPLPSKTEAKGRWITEEEFSRVNERLQEAQNTLDAIQSGAVDAVLVNGVSGSQVYSLVGADQRFRIYVEQMQEGAITASQDGLILYCNRRFAEMVKMPLERVIGASITDRIVGDGWTQISSVFTEGREVVKQETLLECPDGSRLPVHITASRLPALEQNIVCVVVTDLTEQKNQQELRLAKDLADKTNRAKDAFLATLSHELRTPLTPVLMATAALEQTSGLPDHVRADLAMIRRNIELEARLIDDLLDLTRIANGKLELRLARVDVHTAVTAALEICRIELEGKNHRCTVHLDAQRTVTAADPMRVQQALWNLIRNAIKFTPAGGEVTIVTGNHAEESVWVQVRDTGIGFEPHESENLFLPFEQGGRHITRQFGGLGLGLAISTSILHAHSGTIRAESRGLNLGATFTIELPLRPFTGTNGSNSPLTPRAPANIQLRRLRILLVEDHKDTRTSLQRYLQAAENDVTAAATAHEALEVAASGNFDLVISDLGLPDEGGGLAMMRQLRDRHALKGIAVSGYGMDEDVEQSRAAGFSHHLTKPFSLQRLKSLILEVSGQL